MLKFNIMKKNVHIKTHNLCRNLYHYIYNDEIKNSKITLDLSEMTNLHPMGITTIAMFISSHAEKDCAVTMIPPKKWTVREIYEVNGLEKICHIGKQNPNQTTTNQEWNEMSVKLITPYNKIEFFEMIEKEWKHYYHVDEINTLKFYLSELINNVHRHSYSPIDAFVGCFYYPETNSIGVSVADLGITIPVSINYNLLINGKETMSEINCIEEVMHYDDGGLNPEKTHGLNSLFNDVKKKSNHMLLYSGKLAFGYSNGDIMTSDIEDSSIPGTNVQAYITHKYVN